MLTKVHFQIFVGTLDICVYHRKQPSTKQFKKSFPFQLTLHVLKPKAFFWCCKTEPPLQCRLVPSKSHWSNFGSLERCNAEQPKRKMGIRFFVVRVRVSFVWWHLKATQFLSFSNKISCVAPWMFCSELERVTRIPKEFRGCPTFLPQKHNRARKREGRVKFVSSPRVAPKSGQDHILSALKSLFWTWWACCLCEQELQLPSAKSQCGGQLSSARAWSPFRWRVSATTNFHSMCCPNYQIGGADDKSCTSEPMASVQMVSV